LPVSNYLAVVRFNYPIAAHLHYVVVASFNYVIASFNYPIFAHLNYVVVVVTLLNYIVVVVDSFLYVVVASFDYRFAFNRRVVVVRIIRKVVVVCSALSVSSLRASLLFS
jgi:hypothetical protein